MDQIYALGPTAIGLIAAISISVYCWSRFRAASFVILIWFALSVVVGQFAFYPDDNYSQLEGLIRFSAFGTLAFGPAAVLIFVALKVESCRSALSKISTSALLLTQAYRIGGIFLILAYFRGDLPAEVGLVSGIMDVTLAFTAVLLANHLRKDEGKSRRLVIVWSTLSLIDFAWATIVKSATFFGLMQITPAPLALGNPPLLIISLFALPLGIFISLYLILRTREQSQMPGQSISKKQSHT
jgi:hypothetical protein